MDLAVVLRNTVVVVVVVVVTFLFTISSQEKPIEAMGVGM